MYYKTINCKTAKEFLNEITPWNSRYELSDFVFRGHSDDNFLLLPNSFRDREHKEIQRVSRLSPPAGSKYYKAIKKIGYGNMASHHASFEFHVLRRFYRKANSHGLYVPRSKFMSHSMEKDFINFLPVFRLYSYDTWLDRDFVEIASLAQHYGLPTRLIDWSYNPYTAAFFASNSNVPKKNGFISLWMINVKVLSDIFGSKASDVKIYNPHYQWNDNARSQFGLFTYKETKINKETRILEIEYYENVISSGKIPEDERYKSIITDYETMDESIVRLVNAHNLLMENAVNIEDVLVKITLPHSKVNEINKLLRKINISEGSIFPGYDGIVSDLMNRNSIR
ncbi:FRG domain-containing protein [Pectobacterium brasiliense]|uniref:FRG domain-containing protein n=1 Tax=Pectobacterium brasiliense TaxID=180957 RepID=UPI0019692037|nr:FRG domain-containing protein [Pectobacterium brasiliense]MBN3130275.1 FRG domain-containing protein [Pectobacterium brasiliense]